MMMTLHLVKLCVGISTVEELRDCLSDRGKESIHTTRMTPKRSSELLDGGSLYWVIRGVVLARQKLVDIRPFTDKNGIKRCDLVMESRLVPTHGHPRRAFQGWRYLKAQDAPPDLKGGDSLPVELRQELIALGLL